jgi:hypothetical protein
VPAGKNGKPPGQNPSPASGALCPPGTGKPLKHNQKLTAFRLRAVISSQRQQAEGQLSVIKSEIEVFHRVFIAYAANK